MAAAILGLAVSALVAVPAPARAAPPVDAAVVRAAGLVARMTLDEKISMVHGVGYPLPPNVIGYAGNLPGVARLGIPPLYLADSPVGVGNGATGVTQWPDSTALAATWDTALATSYGDALGAEQSGKGNNVALSPTVNILRLPLWGRAPESLGEDPYLAGQTAAAEITGIQSQHVMAVVKHFAANNQEFQRGSINAVVSQRALAEIYEPAFRAAVGAGVGAVMCSYNKINGKYACENGDLLAGTLRTAWLFDGLVVSDWAATHSTVGSAEGGLDLEMPGGADTPFDVFGLVFGSNFNTKLKTAVNSGAVPAQTLDAMVTHVLTAMIRTGVMDNPLPSPLTQKIANVSTAAHQALGTRIAESGSVLLKNDGTLPVDPGQVRSIAVVGDAAGAHAVTGVGGSATVNPSVPIVSPLAGITSRAAGTIRVTAAPGTLGTGSLPPVPGSAFPGGVTASYFVNGTFSGNPIFSQTLGNLDLLLGPPLAFLSTWSARYTGTLVAPATGAYRFTLSAGDAASVWIDGARVVSYRPLHEAVSSGVVQLAAGAHQIRVDVTPMPTNLTTADALAVSTGLHLGWQPQEDVMLNQAAATARAADVAVVVVSDAVTEGRDRSTLALPADQDRLIDAVAAANPHTVVVLNTSGPVLMPWLSHVSGVLETWYPGQSDGTALASLLFGDVDPSGHLPMTFPASDKQGPAQTTAEYPGDGTNVYYDEGTLVGYRWYDAKRLTPLFPFGYGLTYTSFAFGGVSVQAAVGGSLSVSAMVTNTGKRAGVEVAQLYVGFPPAAGEPPRQLKAFARVALAPGQSSRVQFTVPADQLRIWDEATRGWRAVSGTYRAWVGDSSRDDRQSVIFTR